MEIRLFGMNSGKHLSNRVVNGLKCHPVYEKGEI